MNLESHQEALYQACADEHEAYTAYQKKLNACDTFGTNLDEENANILRRATFHQFLSTTRVKVKTSAQTYDIIVLNFLDLLSKSVNMNLRLLSVRLSFNNFYRIPWPEAVGGKETEPDGDDSSVASSESLPQIFQNSFASHSFNCTDDVSSKYGSLTSLLDNNRKKKRKHIWCCVGWKVIL